MAAAYRLLSLVDMADMLALMNRGLEKLGLDPLYDLGRDG